MNGQSKQRRDSVLSRSIAVCLNHNPHNTLALDASQWDDLPLSLWSLRWPQTHGQCLDYKRQVSLFDELQQNATRLISITGAGYSFSSLFY